MKKGLLLTAIFFVMCSLVMAQTFGIKKRPPKPHEYGNILINNYSEKNNIAPVVFKHWLHRSKYTCRLCHVDIGFAMQARGTGIREDDNKNGLYCGVCHNGKESFAPEEKDILGNVKKNCDRCHSYGREVKFKYDFYDFKRKFPRSRFGNKIDWLKAEEKGLIKLKDYIEGVSFKRKPLKIPKETELKAKEVGMPDIIFSHKKHAVWNGCELCHPDIFGIKKGVTVYSMQDIFNGKYCGACHGKVAFPNTDCRLCHTKDVF
jgi:c(7)-type cytochrome triheme protein